MSTDKKVISTEDGDLEARLAKALELQKQMEEKLREKDEEMKEKLREKDKEMKEKLREKDEEMKEKLKEKDEEVEAAKQKLTDQLNKALHDLATAKAKAQHMAEIAEKEKQQKISLAQELSTKEGKQAELYLTSYLNRGFPELGDRVQSHSSSHIATGRAGCTAELRDLPGLLSAEELRDRMRPKFSAFLTVCQHDGGKFKWSTEVDLTTLVGMLLKDIAASLGLQLGVYQDPVLFGLRPDLSIIRVGHHPIGFVEMKKPNLSAKTKEENREPLEDSRVLGQAFDYATLLCEAVGLKMCFGIISTYNTWRVVWLESESSKRPGAPLRIVGPDGRPTGFDGPNRTLQCTKVYHHSDKGLLCLITSAILNMNADKVTARDVEKQTCAIKVNGDSWVWVFLPTGFQLNFKGFPSSAETSFFLFRPLGSGAEGHTWLAASHFGAVCVIKFFHQQGDKDGKISEHLAQTEAEVWRTQWPDAFHLNLANRWAVVMPFLHMVKPDQHHLETIRTGVRDALRSIALHGYVHGDLEWRHVGVDNNTQKVYLVDFGRAVKMGGVDPENVDVLVGKMCENLGI